jgi:hypothetical protein
MRGGVVLAASAQRCGRPQNPGHADFVNGQTSRKRLFLIENYFSDFMT